MLVPDPTRPFVGLYLYNAGEGPAKDFRLTAHVRSVDELPVSLAAALTSIGGDPMLNLRSMLEELYPESPRMVARAGVPKAMPATSSLVMLGILAEDYDSDWVQAFQLLMSHVEIDIECRSLYEEEVTEHFEFHSESNSS